jgi:Cu+-exporting ATPase
MAMPMKKQKDPVCGMMVDSEQSPHKKEFNHKNYAFCSKECLKQFEINPNKFAK